MRVLLDCRMASWTGVGRYTVGLTRALAEREHLDLVLVHMQGEQPPVMPGDAVETVAASQHPFGLRGMRELASAVARAKPELTHCLHFPTPLPARGPLVVTLHDLTPLLVSGVMPSVARRIAYRELNRRACRVADAVVCPSAHTAMNVREMFPRAHIYTTPESASDFAAGPREVLTGQLAEWTAGPYVLGMGSARPHKDLPTLLQAFASLAATHPDLRLILVGKPDPILEVDVAAAGRVHFTGPVTDGELRSLYAGASVFAFPSVYEGFGLPPLEAMAMGTAVVAADATSVPEVVADAGLLVQPRDRAALASALSRVLDQPALREELEQAGLRRAAELSWTSTADKTVEVYRLVLGK